MKFIISIILFLSTAFLTSCDPYYTISLTNKTTDTISVLIKQNFKFYSDKISIGETKDQFKSYKVAPDEIFKLGSAIAGIDNDMPFDSIKIIKANDTISANNLDEIKSLFDSNSFGELQKPYNITIK